MTDTPIRLWTRLGLGAAAGLAAAPAALAGPLAAHPDALVWRVQAEAGEAGESGETGAAPAGESGEAGESGALAAADAEVALLTGLLLLGGHVRSGLDALAQGDADASALHFAHPAAELYETLAPLLATAGLAPLDPALDALEDAPDAAAARAAAESLLAELDTRRAALAAPPADRLAALAAALRVAAQEYAAGVADGAVVEAEEYQDARGFVAAARLEAGALAADPDPAVAAAGADALAALDAAAPAVADFAPAAPLPADGAEALFGAAARIEFAALGLPS